MLKNYLKVAFRNLLKSRVYSLVNIVGLSLGICCAILIGLWVASEYSFDQFHSKKNRIYKAVSEIHAADEAQFWDNTQAILGPTLVDEVAGVEATVRISQFASRLFINQELKVKEEGIYADSTFLQVFDFPLLKGDPKTALNDPYSLILTEDFANTIFPDGDAMGQTITVVDGKREEYTVTGILKKIDVNSSIGFEYIMPFGPYVDKRQWSMEWGNYNEWTFVLLAENASRADISEQIIDFIPEHSEEQAGTRLHLYPFKDLYLRADFSQGLGEAGRIKYVRLFIVIGIIVLCIAMINFMNLSTATASKRAKEVGVRKTTGAPREFLIAQFLGESLLIAFIGTVLAVTIADLVLPLFNELIGKDIEIPYGNIYFILFVICVFVITGVMSGIYPALYLSGFSPAKVLKGAKHAGKSMSGLRKVLVVAQFSLSIFLVICTIVVFNQIQFILNKDLGINKENIVHHALNGAREKVETYRNEILEIPGVENVTFTDHDPIQIGNTTYSVQWPGKGEGEEAYFHAMWTDDYFVETFGLTIIDGKNFKPVRDTANLSFMINEEAVAVMGLDDPVGAKIEVWGYPGTVVGVIKNFNHQSLFQKIDPVVLLYDPESTWRSNVRLSGTNVNETMAQIEKVYKRYESEYPFNFRFVDEDYARRYQSVVNVGSLSNIFAIIAIIVSCLGLFGLSAFMTEQRTKETGVRKVFGASVAGLTFMFSKDFLKLILISFLLSIPLSFYTIDQWLDGFAFRVGISVWPFLIGGLAALVVSAGTVSFHTIRAASANPVDSLKYE